MGRRKPKTQKELFINILDKWFSDEKQILAEWGIRGRKETALEMLKKEYQGYKDMWDKLQMNGESE